MSSKKSYTEQNLEKATKSSYRRLMEASLLATCNLKYITKKKKIQEKENAVRAYVLPLIQKVVTVALNDLEY